MVLDLTGVNKLPKLILSLIRRLPYNKDLYEYIRDDIVEYLARYSIEEDKEYWKLHAKLCRGIRKYTRRNNIAEILYCSHEKLDNITVIRNSDVEITHIQNDWITNHIESLKACQISAAELKRKLCLTEDRYEKIFRGRDNQSTPSIS